MKRLKRVFETFALVLRVDRGRAIAVLVCLVLNSAVAGISSIGLRWLVNAAIDRKLGPALASAALLGFSQGLYAAAFRVQRNYQDLLSQEVSAHIDRDVLTMTSGIPGVEHFERPDYLDKVSQVVGRGAELAATTWAITNAVGLLLRVGVAVWLLSATYPPIGVLPLFAIPSLLATIQGQRLQERLEDGVAEPARMASAMHDLFIDPVSAKEIRVFVCEDELDRRSTELWERIRRRRLFTALAGAMWSVGGWSAFALAFGGAVAVTAVRAARGNGSVGDVVLVIQLANQVRGEVAGASGTLQGVLRAFRTMDRLTWLADYARTSTPSTKGTVVPERLERGISFQGVSFTYPGTKRQVLRDVTLHLAAGSTVAIVGDNGAGKTTLVKLLAGFYAPSSGSITVDGIPVADFDPAEWRQRLSGAFQDFARFELYLRESVGCGRLEAIDDSSAVLAALERGAASDLLDRWDGGLDARLGKSYRNGIEPSGGQWQKVAVSRAMMRRPLVLLLDEPTSALDASTEDALFRRYDEAASDAKTSGGITILVSHRFSTVRAADRIIVLEDGALTEDGTHDELLAAGGRYAEMFTIQAAAYHS